MNTADEKLVSVHIIVHASATASAIVAGTAANIPIIGPMAAGTVLLTGITATMVIAIGDLFGYSFETGAIVGLAGQILGMTLGASLVKTALSIIPGVGAVSNAVVTFGVTESIGWAAYLIFRDGKDIMKLGQAELKSYMDKGQAYAEQAKSQLAWLGALPPHVKVQYDYLTKKLTNPDLGDNERRSILQEIEDLIKPYRPGPARQTTTEGHDVSA
jgi:uncharacterized protein (DUF697 family)